jgi:hypothetical protein
MAQALDIEAARAVAHAFVVKAAKKAGITGIFFSCSQVTPKTPLGPAVITFFSAGTESDAVVVVRKKGAYKVAGIMPVKAIDCGHAWDLAA